MELNNLRDLLEHTIQDAYSAESQIIEALPQMAEKASNAELRAAFEKHLQETRVQKERLEQVAKLLKMDPDGETCLAMQGIIEEANHFMEEDMSDEVCDAGMISMAQKVEHYEIATYGSAIAYCKHLNENECITLLAQTLNEEKMTDETLTQLAMRKVNMEAEKA